ncbi:MAG TPA: response regulator transcription factor [Frankiaceae bacterium]|nr:response regulator transcription factor [Frankiaceae bacterium]
MSLLPDAPAGPPVRLLLVEDDSAIAVPLQEGLIRAGYRVDRVSTGAAAVAAEPADVILLDLGLPDLDGRSVCAQLRRRSEAVIIVVTARSEEAERVGALDVGADDYVVKPFGFAELLARIRANLRRAQPGTGAHLRCGPLVIDTRTRDVSIAGRAVSLTAKEYDLLLCLAEDPGRVYSRQQILERAWDSHAYGPTKALDVHVASLRRKLAIPGLIETAYGVGFRLQPDAGREPTA